MMEEINELQNKLLKLGSKLAQSDTEVKKWHEWFLRQRYLYSVQKITLKLFESALFRYKEFLDSKTKEREQVTDASTSDLIICQYCGIENEQTHIYCTSCGETLSESVSKLLKRGSELAQSDTTIDKMHEWFLEKKEGYENNKLDQKSFKLAEIQYQRFLDSKTKEKEVVTDVSPSDLINCQRCGVENKQTHIYCTSCGEPLLEPELIKSIDLDSSVPKAPLKQTKLKEIESMDSQVSEETEKDISHKTDKIETPEKKSSKSFKDLELEWSEILSFSKITLFGLGLFIIFLITVLVLQLTPGIEGSNRISIGLFGIAFFVLLFGVILDLLRARNYSWQENWSALGAIICYIGVIVNFVPLFLYVVLPNLEGNEFNLLIVEIIGIVLVIIGVTARWSEYDTKIWNQMIILGSSIRYFGYRVFFKNLFSLIWNTIKGLFSTFWEGIKNLPSRIKKFFGMIFNTTIKYFEISIRLLTNAVERILKTIWDNVHWIGLLSILIYVFVFNLSIDQLYINIELVLIILFFFFLGVIFLHSEHATEIIGNTRNRLLKGVISSYSMLSGAKIKVNESIFCSRCLRGVAVTEFAEMKIAKESSIPLCPFCGFENWVT